MYTYMQQCDATVSTSRNMFFLKRIGFFVSVFMCVYFFATPSVFATTDTFTTAGGTTWVAPAGVTSVTVEAWGAGGGGGGSSATNSSGGGGGAGGNYGLKVISVTPGNSYTVVVGSVGAAGATTGSGGKGGDSMFSASSTFLAKGGNGGTVGPAGAAGATSTGDVATTIYFGGIGAPGVAATRSGGGGGGAGDTGHGGNASTTAVTGGVGGTASGGAGGNGRTTGAAGIAGSTYGGGGSGGYRTTTTSRAGAAGAVGAVKITYTIPLPSITVSGTLFSNEGVSAITSTKTIKLAVGTSTPATVYSTTTDPSGNWSFSISGISTSTPLLVWVSGTSSIRAAIFTKSASSTANISGLPLYQNRVIVSHEATTSTSTTIANLAFYDNSNDTDIQYSATSSTGEFTIFGGQELHVWTGKVMELSGSSTLTGDVHIATSSRLVGGATTTIQGHFTNHGTFTENGASVWVLGSTDEAHTWSSVAYGNGIFVAVSDGCTLARAYCVMTSLDGVTWTTHMDSGGRNEWESITYGNGLFVAVAESGTGNRVMTSSDGYGWTARNAAADNDWQSVTYGNGLFVAVSDTGTNNRVMTSPDGITWTSQTSAADNAWESVTYGNGLFVAVACGVSGVVCNGTAGNRVMTSSNGISWSTQTSAANNYWLSVTYGNGLFVAVSITGSGNRIMTSSNGTTWTTRTSPVDSDWFSVTYGNGVFVATADVCSASACVMSSLDGITWKVQTTPKNDVWDGVTYGNGKFVAVAYNSSETNTIMVADAKLFMSSTSAQTLQGTMTSTSTLTNVTFVGTGTKTFAHNASTTNFTINPGATVVAPAQLGLNGTFSNSGTFTHNAGTIFMSDSAIASGTLTGTSLLNNITVTGTGTARFRNSASTTNLTIGTAATLIAPEKLTIAGNFTNNGTYDDGVSAHWAYGSGLADIWWNSVAYGNGRFVAIGDHDTLFSRAAVSTDGVNWTPNNAIDDSWNDIAYGNGTFVAVSSSGGGVMTSNNGVSWASQSSALTADLSAVTYGNGTFVALGWCSGCNQVMTSPNGINWTARSIPSNEAWRDVAYGNGRFVAVGYGGVVMTSVNDGATWTDQSTASASCGGTCDWDSITYGNGKFVALRSTVDGWYGSVATSPDGVTWTEQFGADDITEWTDITYNDGIFVAVGQPRYVGEIVVMTSPDGIAWSPKVSPVGCYWNGITYGNGIYAVVGDYCPTSGAWSMYSKSLVTFSSTTAQSISGTLTGTSSLGTIGFNGASTKTFSNNASTTNFTINSGATVVAPAQLSITGDYTNSGTFTAGTGTTTFAKIESSPATTTISGATSGTSAFSHVVLQGYGTTTFSGNNASTSNLFITNASTTLLAPSLLTIAGNYSNSGRFVASTSGTTTFNGTSQQTLSGNLTGASAFKNLAITNTSGAGDASQSVIFAAPASTTDTFSMSPATSAQFLANSTSTFQNVSLPGGAGQLIYLRSSSAGTRFAFYVPGTVKLATYVDVKDSSACPTTITVTTGGVNSGNTLCWTFTGGGAASTTISGVLYTNEGITPYTASTTINIAISTSTTPVIYSTSTNASGVWSFNVGQLTANARIAMWVNASTSVRAALFTKTTAATSTVTGVSLFKDRVIVSHEGATTSTSTSVTDLAFYDNSDDTDIQYSATSSTGEFTVFNGQKLYIFDGKKFTFTGSSTLTGSVYIATTSILANQGTSTILGHFDNNAGVYSAGTGTTTFSSTTAQSISGTLTGTSSLGTVVFTGSGTKTLANNASTTNFTINTGATVVAPTLLGINGNYNNAGTFTAGSGTTTLTAGATATGTMSGTSAFKNLEITGGTATTTFNAPLTATGHFKATDANASIAFTRNATTTLTTATIQGTAGNEIHLRAATTTGTARWGLAISGAYTISYVDVKDGNGSSSVGDISVTSSIDSGNNNRWSFGSAGPSLTISGTLYSDEGVTVITSAKTIKMAVGTSTPATIYSTTNNGSGVWSFTVASLATSTRLSFWVDADATTRAALFTKSSSSTANIASLPLYQNRVIVSHEGATTSTSTTVADLGFYDSDDDSDIQYNASSTADTFRVLGGQELYIWTGKQLTMAATSTLTGNLHIATSSQLITGATTTIQGHFDNNAGTYYTAGTSTTVFSSTSAQNISGRLTASSSLGHIGLNGAGTKTFVSNASTSNFTVNTGATFVAPAYLTITGHYNNAGTFTAGSGTTTFSSTTAQTIAGTMTGTSAFKHVGLNGASTKTFSSNASTSNLSIGAGTTMVAPTLLSIAGDYNNAGTFTAGSGTTTFNGTGLQSATGTMTGTSAFKHVEVTNNSATTTFNAPFTATGHFKATAANTYLAFPKNATTTLTTATIGGTSGNEVHMRSTTSGTRWGLAISGAYNISYADVKDGNGSSTAGNITATSSVDSGNNNRWTFASGAAGSTTKPSVISAVVVDATTTSASKAVTVPVGTTYVVAFWSAYDASYVTLSSITLDGDAFTLHENYTHTGLDSSYAVGSRVWTKGSGSFNLGWTMDVAPAEGAPIVVAFIKDVSATTPYTDSAGDSWDINYTTQSVQVSSPTSNHLVLGVIQSFKNPGDAPDGAQDDQSILFGIDDYYVKQEAVDLVQENTTDTPTTTITAYGDYPSLVAISIAPMDVVEASASLSSASNQGFYYTQATTTASTMTVTNIGGAPVTAANDIRIRIASTTVNMKWDTTDTTATFGGTASGKVANPVSYENNGTTLVIPVSNDFAAGETLTIDGVSFSQFLGVNAATVGLNMYLGGASDAVSDDADDKTISISGLTTLIDHTAGQVSDNITSTTEVGIPLYAFNMGTVGENGTISSLTLRFTGANGVTDSDLSGFALYRDNNSNGTYEAGDTAVGGTPVLSLTGETGTVTFSTSFTSTSTAKNYVLVGSVDNVRVTEGFTLSLSAADITMSGATSGLMTQTSSLTRVQHMKGGGGGSAGGSHAAIGDAPPSGDGVRGGGGSGGGGGIDPDSGTPIGSEPGFNAPAGQGSPQGAWTSGTNAYTSNGAYTTTSGNGARHTYNTFGFDVPVGNTIVGVEVKVEASGSTAAGTISVGLSWNNGASLTSLKTTSTLGLTDAVFLLGGPADTWGRSWTASEFGNGSFAIEIVGNTSSNTLSVDAIQTKVYHQSSGGGGGGGGGAL